MEFKHDSYTGTSLEWRGFNPWAESFRRYQKNPKLCVGDLSVTLCVVSLLRGLKVGKEIETLAQDGWSFLGNLWDNSQCQLESLPCKKDCKSQFIEWQKKFPSRNWHTHRDGKIFWPWWLDVHLGLNLSFPFFFSHLCLWAGKCRVQFWQGWAASVQREGTQRAGPSQSLGHSNWSPLWAQEIQKE